MNVVLTQRLHHWCSCHKADVFALKVYLHPSALYNSGTIIKVGDEGIIKAAQALKAALMAVETVTRRLLFRVMGGCWSLFQWSPGENPHKHRLPGKAELIPEETNHCNYATHWRSSVLKCQSDLSAARVANHLKHLLSHREQDKPVNQTWSCWAAFAVKSPVSIKWRLN